MIRKQEINYDNYEIYKTLNKDELKQALNEAKIRLEKEKKLVAFLKNLKLEANNLKENLKGRKNKQEIKKTNKEKYYILSETKMMKDFLQWKKDNPKEAEKISKLVKEEMGIK